MAKAYDRAEQVKLYLIHKAQEHYGKDAVGGLTQDNNGVHVYSYTPQGQSHKSIMAQAETVFDSSVFDDSDARSSVSVAIERLDHNLEVHEQMVKVSLKGFLTEIADNVETNDGSMFIAAQSSHQAQEVLRREVARNLAKGGL